MAQLIENKPPRPALIATLLHFDDPTRVVVLPKRARPSPRHTGLPGRRQGEPGRSDELRGSDQRESKDVFWLRRRAHRLTFLIDRACRLEIDLTSEESARSIFLIVAESRFRHSELRAHNFVFDAPLPPLGSPAAPAHESCSAPLDKIALHSPRPGGGMAYAEDLKSFVLNGTCGFD